MKSIVKKRMILCLCAVFLSMIFINPCIVHADTAKAIASKAIPNSVEVKFYKDGSLVCRKTYTVGGRYSSLPSAPSVTGYSFVGWYTAPTGGIKITTTSSVSMSYTSLYARYVANRYTVGFHSNGGSSIPAQTVTYNSFYGPLPTPRRAGYIFDGWYTSPSGGTRITKLTKVSFAYNHTLYARWVPTCYNVTLIVYYRDYLPTSITEKTWYQYTIKGTTLPGGETVLHFVTRMGEKYDRDYDDLSPCTNWVIDCDMTITFEDVKN